MKDKRNLSLVMDFYELTMSQCYFNNDKDKEVVFDLFYRKNPDDGGYCVFAGLEQVVDYVSNLHFEKEDIDYLRSLNQFSEGFLEYLSTVHFTGDIYAIPEGTPVFPHEPLVRVKAPIIEAQLVETALLLAINHQTLIATKSRRIVQASEGRAVMEFGARRAHNFDAAILGARAAYIAGCAGSATTYSGKEFGVPVLGTMAHSFIQSFDTEYDAFMYYAKTYPNACTLLIDTYSTLKSGIVNAIKVAKDYLEPNGYRLQGVRIDSGDMAYLSKKVRKMLDEAGMEDCKIVVSNSLDEYVIESLIHQQGAKIDSFGVGENLICSKNSPVFGGVYKMVALEKDGQMIPKIKISDNVEKVTNPGMKNLNRIMDKETGMAIADLLTLEDEVIDTTQDLTIYHPMSRWKYKVIPANTYTVRDMLVPIFKDGKLVYDLPSLEEIRAYSEKELATIWDEIKRFVYPQEYYVPVDQLFAQSLKQNFVPVVDDRQIFIGIVTRQSIIQYLINNADKYGNPQLDRVD